MIDSSYDVHALFAKMPPCSDTAQSGAGLKAEEENGFAPLISPLSLRVTFITISVH